MNALSSPLESVAFDYFISDVSTIFISKIWTCFAIICAGAASFFWRAKSPAVTLQLPSPQPNVVASLNPSNLPAPASEPEMYKLASKPSGYGVRVKEPTILESSTGGVTKSKFLAYYYSDDCENICNDDEQYEFNNGDGEVHAELLRWFKVERLERMKEMNEMGWYCCQDLTVLSGDIVRLWDDGRL